MRRSVLARARSSSIRTFHTSSPQLTGARQPPSSSPSHLESTPSYFHPKPHLRPEALQGVLRYSSSPISSSSTVSASPSSSPSASAPYSTRSTVPPTATSSQSDAPADSLGHPPAPVSPKLPPRRRPNYQAAGFGLSGDYGRRSPTASASSSGSSRRGRAGAKGKDEVPVSPELPLQPGERVAREQQEGRQSSFAGTEGESSSSLSLNTATGGSVNFAPSNTNSPSTSTAGKNAPGAEVVGVKGTEMRRMDEGEKEAVDGNEAEACYVVSVRILRVCLAYGGT